MFLFSLNLLEFVFYYRVRRSPSVITIGDNPQDEIVSCIVNKHPFHRGATYGFTYPTRFQSAFNLYRLPHVNRSTTSVHSEIRSGDKSVIDTVKNGNFNNKAGSSKLIEANKLCLSCLLSQSDKTSTYCQNSFSTSSCNWKSLGARFYHCKRDLVSRLRDFSGTPSLDCTCKNFKK